MPRLFKSLYFQVLLAIAAFVAMGEPGMTAGVSVDIASGTEVGRVTFPNPNCYN